MLGRTGLGCSGEGQGSAGVLSGLCLWCGRTLQCSPPASLPCCTSRPCPPAPPVPFTCHAAAQLAAEFGMSAGHSGSGGVRSASNASSSAGGGTGRFSVGSPPVSLLVVAPACRLASAVLL